MRKRLSVAMAAFNGEKYIREQIDSILCQLSETDELVVSYDESSDATRDILNEYSQMDKRVKVYNNPYQHGVVKNFQNALEQTSGEIVFFSDQDDVWFPNKIDTVMKYFDDPKIAVVFHDAILTDAQLNVKETSTFKLRGGARETVLGNLFRLSYIGCCMAFRAKYKPVILPIPTIYRSHDWWTGCLLGTGSTHMKAVRSPLIYHRIYGENATPMVRPSLGYQVQVRWIIIKNIVARFRAKRLIDKEIMK